MPNANFHSLHPGELVLNRSTVKMVQGMLDKNQLPRALHKRINVLMKRRPQKVSNRELARVTRQVNQKRGLVPCKTKNVASKGVKKSRTNKGKCGARKTAECAAEASQTL